MLSKGEFSKGPVLCTSTGDVPLSGWGQRSGILHKNINATPKIPKTDFYENFHDFFDIFVHAHDIFMTPYRLMYGTIVQYST